MAKSTGPDLTDDHREILQQFLDESNEAGTKKEVVEKAFEALKSALPDYDKNTNKVSNLWHWMKVQ